MTISARILADSLHPNGSRLTTYVLRYPRFIHAEIMTHRMFSRNASSSRAIPVAKFLNAMRDEPAMPEVWFKNKPGMQGTELMDDETKAKCQNIILRMRDVCAAGIEELDNLGLHKQTANRYGEPWHHISVIISGTEWANFFALRDHPDAQPEFGLLARMMRSAYDASTPIALECSQWHLPYVSPDEVRKIGIAVALKCSVARCARVSYLNHDGTQPSVDKDVELHDRLVVSKPLHASPAEHQARVSLAPPTPSDSKVPSLFAPFLESMRGNFAIGWVQYRKLLPHENVLDMPAPRTIAS